MGKRTFGTVVAVSLSPRRGIPKHPQAEVEVRPDGIAGDFHAGPINRHKKSGPEEPNDRAVSVVAVEMFQALNEALGIDLKPGDFAENVLLAGHGDLSDLEEGDEVWLGESVVLRVSKQNKPCATLTPHHPDIVQRAMGRRGVVATVATVGKVKPGDRSVVVRQRAEGA